MSTILGKMRVTNCRVAITMSAMIKTILLSIAIVVMASPSAFASDDASTPNMLAVAARQAALLDSSDRPFVMDVEFTVQLDQLMQGHLRFRWEAKDRWWSRVSMGKFEQVKFQQGERTYTLRNVDFTPKQVYDLVNLLHVGEAYHRLLARADKPRMEGGVRLECLDAQNPGPKFKWEHFDICVDSTTHDVVTETRRYVGYAADDVYRQQFSDFVEFGGHRYPRRLESFKNEHLIISANVTGLQESTLDPKLLVPPTGAIERRECPDNFKAPEIIDQPRPNFDPGNHKKTETEAEVTVLVDGSVGNVAIVGSAGRANDEPTINALKHWKFKPAMCGAEPVVADIYVHFKHEFPFIR